MDGKKLLVKVAGAKNQIKRADRTIDYFDELRRIRYNLNELIVVAEELEVPEINELRAVLEDLIEIINYATLPRMTMCFAKSALDNLEADLQEMFGSDDEEEEEE